MSDGSPTLEVGFAIDTEGSFESLRQLQAVMDSTEGRIVAEAAKIERATAGMVNLDGATAKVVAFGNAATREMQTSAREMAKAEKAGEGLIRSIERQSAAFGLSRDELRRVKAETAALAAEQQGLFELAARIRAAESELAGKELAAARRARFEAEALEEAKADAEAQAAIARAQERVRAEAAVTAQLVERNRLEQALERNTGLGRMSAQDGGATVSALAAKAAEDEARANDQAAAAARRLAQEHNELAAAVRGSHAAQEADAASAERLRMATDPLYAATKRLNEEIAESTRLYYSGATAPAEYARQQEVLRGRLTGLSEQFDRVNAASGRSRHTMIQFGMQMNDVATMAALGAPPMQIFASQIGQVVQVAQMAEGGVKGFASQLGALAIAYGPLIVAAGVAAAGLGLFQRAMADGIDTGPMIEGLGLTKAEIKKLENTTVSFGDVATATFQVLAENVGINLGDVQSFFSSAMDFLTKAGRMTLAALYSQFVGTFRAIGAIVQGVFSGKGIGEILSDVGNSYKNAFNEADQAMIKFGGDVKARIASNKLADLQKQAAAIKADRTPKTSSKGETLADRLAREAAAIEAQIRNLHALADAYGVSGAEALIAEARVKAETAAIKKRGEVEEFVNRQIRLAIAERIVDAAKSSAAMRDQAEAQRLVNDQVAAGLVPASQAADMVKDQLADLPLLAAIQAAQQRGLVDDVERATKALADQRREREQLRIEEEQARFNSDMAAGENRLAVLREEMRLVGATTAERNVALAVLQATQEAQDKFQDPVQRAKYIEQQRQIAIETQNVADATRNLNDELSFTADRWDLIAQNVQYAASGMADAFGDAGRAIGDMASIFADFSATRERLELEHQQNLKAGMDAERENARYALRTATLQIGAFGDMTSAAKGFFKEKSDGYKALAAAEKAFRAIEFALSVRAMAQDIKETGLKILNSGAKAAASAVEAIAKAIASLPFPANLAAGAATAAALAAIGIKIVGAFGGGGKNSLEKANDGTGTILGDADAKSDSIKNAIDALHDVNTTTSVYAREMAASLRSINSQIGGLATVLVRAGRIDASDGIATGFAPNLIGKVLGSIPLIGGVLGGLFGSKTTIIGGGLYGGPQTLDDILSAGFDAQTYTDVKKKKKFFGVTTSTKYRTEYGEVDAALEQQFTMLLASFNDAILAAAGPLGENTSDITQRLQNFVVDIGKIDLKDLTGEEIEEKLQAVFGAAADNMAAAAFPGIERFQKVGEGMFETLVRVASTVEAVTMSLDMLGTSVVGLDIKMGLADQFDSVSELTSAVGAYFEAFYTEEEQLAARTAQMTTAINSLGLSMPTSLDGFRSLVEAQDLTTEAGRRTYAMLLQMAPAFADLQEAMSGAKSAADIASERENLQRQIYQLLGNIDAIRALDLAKIDESNKALQEQVWAIQDAQEAAKAAQELRDAWSSVGDGIMDEVDRIRGLSGARTGANFATLMGQFNAATEAARAGDMDAARDLPGLSQAMLAAAALVATSRQELDRVQADTAASLEATNAAIAAYASGQQTEAQIVESANTAQQANSANDNENEILRLAYEDMRAELAGMRAEMANGISTIANNTGKTKRILENVTAASGGDAITTVYGAA